jgi:uncharacterized membrane protein
MLFDLSVIVSFVAVFAAIAALASVTAVAALVVSLRGHRRVRVARHESVPTYYRRLVLAH